MMGKGTLCIVVPIMINIVQVPSSKKQTGGLHA